MFVDRVKLKFTAGKGGNGVVAWRREKYIPKGGPTGGNGGRGADVVFQADTQTHSLEWFRHRKLIQAEHGRDGGPNRQQGRCGKDLVIKVPCGTLVKHPETGDVICDLVEDGQRWIACQGGKGGRGNDSFKSPTNQAPNKATPGRPGEENEFELELKLIADVGLVGFPNAGKSTFITSVAKVPVKIAPYPFTTLRPNLGYVEFDDFSRILIADIPGIIAGAHENRGLGFEFLRHIERTEVLVFLIDMSGIDGRNPIEDFEVLWHELQMYNAEMLKKPFLVALNKMDTEDSLLYTEEFYKKYSFDKKVVFEISALERQGLDTLMQAIKELAQAKGMKF